MNIQMIQLNRLTACPANVRKSGIGIGIDELAASIAAHGLLENLAKLKKDALAARAEEKLAGTGWLPAILREPVPVFGACAGPETAFSEAA